MTQQPHTWEQRCRAAQQEIEATLQALPPPLRREARKVPVMLEPRPTPEMVADQLPADTLGLFVGEAFPETYAGGQDVPAQVFLFLDNLWDYVHHDRETFREEVRRTLLHELGHYLGLDEEDLLQRDLD